MKKNLVATVFVVLLSAGWLFAQQTTSNQSSNMGQSSSHAKTVTGCLSQSQGAAATGANYILTEQSGNTFQLKGDTAQLSKHVGQKVRVRGTRTTSMASNSSSATGQSGAVSGNAAAGSSSSNTLTVKSVKKIAATCSATGASQK